MNIGDSSDIFYDLDDNNEAQLLKKWYSKIKDQVDQIKNLSAERNGSGESNSKNATLTLLEFIEFATVKC